MPMFKKVLFFNKNIQNICDMWQQGLTLDDQPYQKAINDKNLFYFILFIYSILFNVDLPAILQ